MAGRPHPLQVAMHVAQLHEEAAVKALVESRQGFTDLQNRIEQLLMFRSSYATLFQTEGGDGISARRFQDYSVFLNSLDQGIHQSQRQLERLRQELWHQQQTWRRSHAKKKALEGAIEHSRKEQLRRQNHREQRDTDEHSLRHQATRPRLAKEDEFGALTE